MSQFLAGLPLIVVDRESAHGDDGMAQTPADAAWLASLPGFGDRLSHALDEALPIFAGLDDALLGNRVRPFFRHRSCVRVRCVENNLSQVDAVKPILQLFAKQFGNPFADRDEVAGDEDRLVDGLLIVAGFNRQRGRGHRRFDFTRDPQMTLSSQSNRFVGSDADSRSPDPEFTADRTRTRQHDRNQCDAGN